MDSFFSLQQLFTTLLFIIPTLLIIGISSYYLIKVGPKIEGILLLVSHVIFFLCTVINNVVFSGIFSFDSDHFQTINIFTSIFSFIGSVLLVIGLFILMNKVIINHKK